MSHIDDKGGPKHIVVMPKISGSDPLDSQGTGGTPQIGGQLGVKIGGLGLRSTPVAEDLPNAGDRYGEFSKPGDVSGLDLPHNVTFGGADAGKTLGRFGLSVEADDDPAEGLLGTTTPAGFALGVALRGPGGSDDAADAFIEDSMQACMRIFMDASAVLTPEALDTAHKNIDVVMDAWGQVQDAVDTWLVGLGTDVPIANDGGVPFWTSPLKYPDDAGFDEAHFEFALQIREHVVTLLASKQDMLLGDDAAEEPPA